MTRNTRAPNDIPIEITRLAYRRVKAMSDAGPVLSQNQLAALLAELWPSIERHIRDTIAADVLNDRSESPWRYSTGAHYADHWIDRRDRTKAITIILNGPIPEAT